MMLTCGDVVVELRGFEPLTPCMPLTSRPLAPQHASTRCLISVLLSTQITMKRHGADCGDVRSCCWQIAGKLGSNAHVLVSFAVRRFSTNSRPALQAADGRPRAGSDPTGTGEPASSSMRRGTKPHAGGGRSSRSHIGVGPGGGW